MLVAIQGCCRMGRRSLPSTACTTRRQSRSDTSTPGTARTSNGPSRPRSCQVSMLQAVHHRPRMSGQASTQSNRASPSRPIHCQTYPARTSGAARGCCREGRRSLPSTACTTRRPSRSDTSRAGTARRWRCAPLVHDFLDYKLMGPLSPCCTRSPSDIACTRSPSSDSSQSSRYPPRTAVQPPRRRGSTRPPRTARMPSRCAMAGMCHPDTAHTAHGPSYPRSCQVHTRGALWRPCRTGDRVGN